MEAEITLDYADERAARAIAVAVSPDNVKVPQGLSIRTECDGKKVITVIKCEREIPSFIATIDDLLFCVSIAEKTLQATRKLNR